MAAAGGLVGGAVLGALLGELLKAILDLGERTIHFNPVLKDIRFQLESLSSVIKQLDAVKSDFLDCPENTNNLGELINKGKLLILKCDAVKGSNKFLKYPKAPFYTRKLRNFDAEFQRASNHLLLQLNVEQMKKLAMLMGNDNNAHCTLLLFVDKIKKIVVEKVMGTNCSCSVHTCANHASPETKLPLQFYHDKQLKGKTGPNFADALLGRVVEHIKEKDDSREESGKTSGTDHKGVEGRIEERMKELGEVRYEKIFHRTFETVAHEKLQNWFRCDLSTEVTSLSGVLFISSAKLAFCSHRHIPHDNTKWLFLKVVMPFQLLKAVRMNPSDEDDQNIQVISVDNQEFRFIKFRNYNDAKKCLQEVPVTPTTCSRCRML